MPLVTLNPKHSAVSRHHQKSSREWGKGVPLDLNADRRPIVSQCEGPAQGRGRAIKRWENPGK